MSNSYFSFSMIQNRYGGTNPIRLSEYFDGEGFITNNALPSLGNGRLALSMINALDVAQLYGKPHTCIRQNTGFHVNMNTLSTWFTSRSNITPLLENIFPNFFYYNFEGGSNSTINYISDGGNDMFDGGNYISVTSQCLGLGNSSNDPYNAIPYGNIISEPSHGVYVSQPFTYPHMTFTYFQSDEARVIVYGNTGSDGGGSVSNVPIQSYNTSNGRYGDIWTCMNGLASDPSIIDTWFTICNSNWSTKIMNTDDQRKQSDTNDYSHYIGISGSNFILCKLLFALSNGQLSDASSISNFITSFVENMPLTITASNNNNDVRNLTNGGGGDD